MTYIFPLMFALVSIVKRTSLSYLALSISLLGLLFVSSDVVFQAHTDKIVSQALLNSLFAALSAIIWRSDRSKFSWYVMWIVLGAAIASYARLFFHFIIDDVVIYDQIQSFIAELLEFGAFVILGLITFTPGNKDFVGYVRGIIADHSWNSALRNDSLHRKD